MNIPPNVALSIAGKLIFGAGISLIDVRPLIDANLTDIAPPIRALIDKLIDGGTVSLGDLRDAGGMSLIAPFLGEILGPHLPTPAPVPPASAPAPPTPAAPPIMGGPEVDVLAKVSARVQWLTAPEGDPDGGPRRVGDAYYDGVLARTKPLNYTCHVHMDTDTFDAQGQGCNVAANSGDNSKFAWMVNFKGVTARATKQHGEFHVSGDAGGVTLESMGFNPRPAGQEGASFGFHLPHAPADEAGSSNPPLHTLTVWCEVSKLDGSVVKSNETAVTVSTRTRL